MFCRFLDWLQKDNIMRMKLQWQVEKVTQTEPLYILGYTSNLGRVKKEVVKWVKSAEKVPRTG
mgnify:FL=1